MNRVSLVIGFVVLLSASVAAEPPKEQAGTVTIPLDQVSGIGPRGLRALEPDLLIYRDTPEKWEKYSTPEGIAEIKRLSAKSLVLPIEKAMQDLPRGKDATVGPGFAVRGSGRTALPGTYDVLVKGDKPEDRFPAGTEVSVVFYARSGPPLRFDRIERSGNAIEIRYMLISQGLAYSRWHLSLIPLGKLPPGTYHVDMNRATENESSFNQRGFPPIKSGVETNYVCRPFSFSIIDNP